MRFQDESNYKLKIRAVDMISSYGKIIIQIMFLFFKATIYHRIVYIKKIQILL